MAHDRDAAGRQVGDRRRHALPAFQFDRARAGFLHDARGRAEGLFGAFLVAAEGHVHDDQRAPRAAHHGGAVRDHHVQRDRHGGRQAVDGLRQAVAHEQGVAVRVQQFCHARRVGGEHHQRLLALAGPERGDARPGRAGGSRGSGQGGGRRHLIPLLSRVPGLAPEPGRACAPDPCPSRCAPLGAASPVPAS
ncbi:hypothetical protein D9M68_758260 [compost metagenome]